MILSEERIRELSALCTEYREDRAWAIRIAVRETAEACAKICDDIADKARAADCRNIVITACHCADNIRDAAK